MRKLLTVMERFAPEAIQIMNTRYLVLRQVLHNQPIGRRQMGKNVGCTERLVRAEIETLRTRGALQMTPAGIYLTPYGEEMLRDIDEIVPWLFNIQILADKLKERFGLDEVVIVPGDSFYDSIAREDLGRAGAEYLRKKLFSSCILAVTGGTTLARVANAMREGLNANHVCVVPARGGLGQDVELQAGSIAAKIAGE
jgi:central glycolytic genes regulator